MWVQYVWILSVHENMQVVRELLFSLKNFDILVREGIYHRKPQLVDLQRIRVYQMLSVNGTWMSQPSFQNGNQCRSGDKKNRCVR